MKRSISCRNLIFLKHVSLIYETFLAFHWRGESATPRVGESATPRLAESESRQLPDSPSRRVVFRLRISPRIRSQNRNCSKCSVRDQCRTDFCKNTSKSASLPCPFNYETFLAFQRRGGRDGEERQEDSHHQLPGHV